MIRSTFNKTIITLFISASLVLCLLLPAFVFAEQTAVINSTNGWYLYGLVITDIDLVKEFFRKAENIMGESIKQKKLQEPAVVSVLSDFFRLKINWKYKTTKNRLGKYYFSEAEYNIARIEYKEKFGLPHASPYDKILISLESEFTSREELLDAESIIKEKIHRFIDVYQAKSNNTY